MVPGRFLFRSAIIVPNYRLKTQGLRLRKKPKQPLFTGD